MIGRDVTYNQGKRLNGLTFGDDFVEAYYVGDPNDAQAINQFTDGIERAGELITLAVGEGSAKVKETLWHLWPYGRGDGGIGWPGVHSDVSAKPEIREAGIQRAKSALKQKTAQQKRTQAEERKDNLETEDKASPPRNLDEAFERATAIKPRFDQWVRDVANALQGEAIIPASVKGRKRAEERVNNDYAGDHTKIKDLVRASIVFDSVADAQNAMKLLEELFPEAIVKKHSRPGKITPGGYRDGKLFIPINYIYTELQVHVRPMLAAKEQVHVLYEQRQEIERRTDQRHPRPEQRAQIDELNRKMRDIYDSAWYLATKARNFSSEINIPLRYTLSIGKGRLLGSNAKYPNTGDVIRATGMSSTSKNSVPGGNSIEASVDKVIFTHT